MYYTYILESESNGRYYIGCTDNIEKRIQAHNKGLSKYTKNKGPWVIIYKEEFETLCEARIREKKIKSW